MRLTKIWAGALTAASLLLFSSSASAADPFIYLSQSNGSIKIHTTRITQPYRAFNANLLATASRSVTIEGASFTPGDAIPQPFCVQTSSGNSYVAGCVSLQRVIENEGGHLGRFKLATKGDGCVKVSLVDGDHVVYDTYLVNESIKKFGRVNTAARYVIVGRGTWWDCFSLWWS